MYTISINQLLLEIKKITEIYDQIYTFCEVLTQIDLKRHLVVKENSTGRKRFDSEILLKFAFIEHGYISVIETEKLCKTDIRFMLLLEDNDAPSFMTIDNFMNPYLVDIIDKIFEEINNKNVFHGVNFDIRTEYAIEYL